MAYKKKGVSAIKNLKKSTLDDETKRMRAAQENASRMNSSAQTNAQRDNMERLFGREPQSEKGEYKLPNLKGVLSSMKGMPADHKDASVDSKAGMSSIEMPNAQDAQLKRAILLRKERLSKKYPKKLDYSTQRGAKKN